MASLEQPRCTPAQYLEWERAAPYKSQYLNGEIFAMAGASEEHNILMVNVLAEIRPQIRGKNCRTYGADMWVQVSEAGMYTTYPDAIIVCGERRFSDSHLDTLLNPTVLVEVLSPSTELYDRGEKFAHYQRLPSLTDYVLIAQDKMRVGHYARQGTQWMLSFLEHASDTLQLPSAECALSLASFYENIPLPAPAPANEGTAP